MPGTFGHEAGASWPNWYDFPMLLRSSIIHVARAVGFAIVSLVALAVLTTGSSAFAKPAAKAPTKAPSHKVNITTDPPGATVYIGDKESGAKGITPVTLDLPVGETTLILELMGYQQSFQTVTVVKPKGRAKPQVAAFTLTPDMGHLDVKGPAGAKITVDGKDSGVVPAVVDVNAGGHQVEVSVSGQKPYQEFVTVAGGATVAVVASIKASDDDGEIVSGGGGGTEPGAEPHHALIDVGLTYMFGARSYTYSGNTTPTTLQPLSQSGASVIGIAAQFWVGRLSHAHWLHGLSIVGSFGFGLSQDVTGATGGPLTTAWQTLTAGLRYRIPLGEKFGLDIDAGYGNFAYRFTGDATTVADVPDAQYSTVRLGGTLVFHQGIFEAYLGGEERVVLSIGEAKDHFQSASANGIAGKLGVRIVHEHLFAALEGGYAAYSLTFTPTATPTYNATGATDSQTTAQLLLGVRY